MRRLMILTLSLALVTLAVSATFASEAVYTGTLDTDHPDFIATFELAQGESVMIEANATSGDLDTVLSLADPEGIVVAENDDRDRGRIDSAVGYTAAKAGTYTLTLSRYDDGSSGDYELFIHVGDADLLDLLDTHPDEVQLSGPELTVDTPHFRIHYTLTGKDRATEAYAREVAKTMEEVWGRQIHEMGWPPPPNDGRGGGDSRFDVYLIDMLDSDGYGALGTARPGLQYGDNPSTAAIERYATSVLIRLDNDFAELETPSERAIDLMRATAAHEFHHAIQFGFDQNDMVWYNEATSVWIETQVYPKWQDATGYVEYAFDYPELCFGTQSDPGDGLLMYGDWLFMQSLVDAYGDKAIPKLWSNIAAYDGFEALEQTVGFYGDSLPDAVARYRVQNLVRDYKFAPEFENASVWLGGDIGSVGRLAGEGVQELGANYIAFHAAPDLYRVTLEDNDSLDLWAVGIADDQAEVMWLGQGGTISNQDYDHLYLIVFNPAYDDDLYDCEYAEYAIRTMPANGTTAPVVATWDAAHFLPLRAE